MRIAMLAACPFPSPQGSQVFAGQMCERLAARGHEVHLLTYGQGRTVNDRGYRHHRITRLPGDDASRSGPRLVKPLLDALLVRAMVSLLGKHSFDVVHCHNYEAAVVGVAARALRKVPVVYHSHNLMGDELATYFVRRSARAAAAVAGRLLDATVPRAADQVIALCQFSAGVLRSHGVSSERITVIAPAVDDDGAAGDVERARRALGLPGVGTLVGYCGNLDRYQNLDLLLAAFALLIRERDARLLIATHADDPSFARTVAERGLEARVIVVKADSWHEARRAMEACDVLVSSRRHGSGVPIKLLNYLSLGRPVVAAGCGAKVLAGGVDAVVTDDDDPAALAAALRALADDAGARVRLGSAGRARFLRDFTWDAVLPAVERVYERCRAAAPGYARMQVEGRTP